MTRSTGHALDPGRTITVVSGLPRSGTSLMMQMLGAAGLELVTDGVRAADADNPGGYYELEAVKRLAADASFLEDAVGRVVKIVAPLLPHLSPDYDYRVILMERDLDEVLASQRAMLARRDEAGEVSAHEDASLARAFAAALRKVNDWLAGRENVRTCSVSHRRLLDDPEATAAALAAFLRETGVVVQEDAARRMAAVVDSGLHRQRGV